MHQIKFSVVYVFILCRYTQPGEFECTVSSGGLGALQGYFLELPKEFWERFHHLQILGISRLMFFTLTSQHSSINDRLFTFFKCFYLHFYVTCVTTDPRIRRSVFIFFLYSDFKKRILDKTDFWSNLGVKRGHAPSPRWHRARPPERTVSVLAVWRRAEAYATWNLV